uniref:Uncharacterized protein n=1 Tax=Romanomermis culicivorax TaxID=13658 RepID=A0A915J485_ROMCU
MPTNLQSNATYAQQLIKVQCTTTFPFFLSFTRMLKARLDNCNSYSSHERHWSTIGNLILRFK